jgi:hypothetical protein
LKVLYLKPPVLGVWGRFGEIYIIKFLDLNSVPLLPD